MLRCEQDTGLGLDDDPGAVAVPGARIAFAPHNLEFLESVVERSDVQLGQAKKFYAARGTPVLLSSRA